VINSERFMFTSSARARFQLAAARRSSCPRRLRACALWA
jgi:hypothetical protein